MKQPMKYLNDEHMQQYEWSGLGDGMAGPCPARSKRTHPWHASYSVLAVLTSLLILNGCDKQSSAEQASELVGQAAQETEQPLFDDSPTPPAYPEAAAPAAEGMGEPAAENAGQAGETSQQP
jgi:hypothetical protein